MNPLQRTLCVVGVLAAGAGILALSNTKSESYVPSGKPARYALTNLATKEGIAPYVIVDADGDLEADFIAPYNNVAGEHNYIRWVREGFEVRDGFLGPYVANKPEVMSPEMATGASKVLRAECELENAVNDTKDLKIKNTGK